MGRRGTFIFCPLHVPKIFDIFTGATATMESDSEDDQVKYTSAQKFWSPGKNTKYLFVSILQNTWGSEYRTSPVFEWLIFKKNWASDNRTIQKPDTFVPF